MAVYSAHRAFDCQLSEVDDLLDAEAKLVGVHTSATADDRALVTDRSTSRTVCSCCHPSKTLWSGTSTASDIFDEVSRPQTYVVNRWLEGQERHSSSEARVTRRGVDCRLNLGDKVCEWVVFL